MNERRYRVVQWATGKVGKLSLRAILDDSRLELVGVYAHSKEKVGQDAGALCGRSPVHVLATDDIEQLIAARPDIVIYSPFMADLDAAIHLLEQGINIISTNLFLNVGGIRGEVKERLEEACRRGNASLLITGVNPGWINAVAVAMTAVCRQVESVRIVESANCATYESVETWTTLGMGTHGVTPALVDAARDWLILFRDAVERVATALALTLDETEFFVEFATAAERIDLGWYTLEEGSNAALRGGWHGKIAGKTAVTIEVVWYLTKKLRENWDIDEDQYHLTVVGEPGVDTRIRFLPPDHWGNHEWDITTALPAVSAIEDVVAARPGILGLRDAGLPRAPAGFWPR